MGKYLTSLLEKHSLTATKLGLAGKVPTSRASQWIEGSRWMSPEVAFDLGSSLRSFYACDTSGAEFLWAGGYWAELFYLMKYFALDKTLGADASVMLYAWLPRRMAALEHQELWSHARGKYALSATNRFEEGDCDEIEALRDLAAANPEMRELDRYFEAGSILQRDQEMPVIYELLNDSCKTNEFHFLLAQAWERSNGGKLEAPRVLSDILGDNNQAATLELLVIDAIIESAEKLSNGMFPSYAAPKLWRMASSWFYEVADSGPYAYFDALPSNFLIDPAADLRRAEAAEEARSAGELRKSQGLNDR